MNELSLIRKAIKGNKKCLQELLILHSDQLYRTAFLYVRNREDALDVVQEASYKAFKSIGNLKNEKYFLTWLTRILIHCSYEVLNKKKKEIPLDIVKERTVDRAEQEIESLDLIDAVNQLNEKHKDAIILFYFQDLPITEVAKIMNIPENSVKTYLSRGKERLKKLLGGMNHNGEKLISRSI
ncbi:sigma-70 family RNA polymerase sigma factor [Bacillus sp. es.034]|uniref:sigma-70 family RNA polymerase sigma factor n=1 Tax=Bacillus sp. es.034 TaxID=1761763 RepID=UPI000BF7B8F8|nr:sigma-70 family RNA polymerase sigma factor [Bacillus sp. es.034]PFG04547.1 RNA polymerase sigma-70 factor (ECF subfamily) [Bacillus sp. es.034]